MPFGNERQRLLESGKRQEFLSSNGADKIPSQESQRHIQDRQEKPKKKQSSSRVEARDPPVSTPRQGLCRRRTGNAPVGTGNWTLLVLLVRDLQRLPPRSALAAESASAAPGPRAVRLASTCQAKSRTNMPLLSRPTSQERPGAFRRPSGHLPFGRPLRSPRSRPGDRW